MGNEDRPLQAQTDWPMPIEGMERLYPQRLPAEQAKEALLQIGRRLYEKGYAAANDGNISYLLAPGRVLATPTGVSKGFMTTSMLVVVDSECRVLEGDWLPSTELLLHLRVYQENPEARAVIHAHSPIATAFACAGIPLDRPILAEALNLLGQVPVAPYAAPGTQELAASVVPYLQTYAGVLLANHGVLTWGASLTEAMYRLERIEHYAKLMLLTGHLPQPAISLAVDL